MIVVDATKDLLVNVLKYHPFLVKPNNHELGEIFGIELKTRKDVIPYGKKLQEKGARNVDVYKRQVMIREASLISSTII